MEPVGERGGAGVVRDRILRGAPFGYVDLLSGFLRRRVGTELASLRHRHVTFGPLCDIGRGTTFRVAAGTAVDFGAGCVVDRGGVVECSAGRLSVGAGTVFGHHCTLAVVEEVVIGEHCLLAELVSIRDHDHAFTDPARPIVSQGTTSAPVHIGDGVWLGAKVTVTKGVTIGPGTVVGANAVVTSDLPAGVVAAGVPARVLRVRDGWPDRPGTTI
ncbi:MAG: acyltransferase [Acidimicrobiales bacterium]